MAKDQKNAGEREVAGYVVKVVGLDPPPVTLDELLLLERFAGDLIAELAASNDNEEDPQ